MIDWSAKAVNYLSSHEVIGLFEATGITGNMQDLFDAYELNRRLQILIECHLQHQNEDGEVEVEYMDHVDQDKNYT